MPCIFYVHAYYFCNFSLDAMHGRIKLILTSLLSNIIIVQDCGHRRVHHTS